VSDDRGPGAARRGEPDAHPSERPRESLVRSGLLGIATVTLATLALALAAGIVALVLSLMF
jgi:hypothetical protein